MNNRTPRLISTCSPDQDRTGIIGETTGINGLPHPHTAADCDLRDHAFMPLDVARLCNSGLAHDETLAACGAAVLLRCVSWHQLPAASLPDDDEWLAKRVGYWHRGKIDRDWPTVRDAALRDWIKCSDGRLYHPTLAAKARDAWAAELKQCFHTECTLIKQNCRRRRIESVRPDFDEWLPSGCHQRKARDASSKRAFPTPGEAKLTTRGANSGRGATMRASEKHAMSAADISASLIRWELKRGKSARGFSANHVHVIALARMALTPRELRRAYDSAVADRLGTNDHLPVNAGFVKKFAIKHRNRLQHRNPFEPRPKADG
ncbi:hypothetical protein [Paraburkholderia sp. RL17-337-BIB-A]|uniref:hypothetical protein n=1 Tax=Paraburkholderia sp. RL17-337-BIB-A TaxID=3031636 RepID=UPI0038B87B06